MLENLANKLAKNTETNISGICDQAKPYLISKLIPPEKLNQPVFCFLKNESAVTKFANTQSVWQKSHKNIMIFQSIDEKSLDLDNEKIKELFINKQIFLSDLAQNKPNFYILSIDQINNACASIKGFEKNSLNISHNEAIDPNDLSKDLTSMGYQRETAASAKGLFSKKGGTIEVYPINHNYPIRFEFFGNTIDQITNYNPKDNKKINNLDSIFIAPIKTNDSFGKLLDYLLIPQNPIIILDNPSDLKESADPFSNKSYVDFENKIKKHKKIIFQSFPEEQTINLDYQNISDYSLNLPSLKNDLNLKYKNWNIFIINKDNKKIKKIFSNLEININKTTFHENNNLKNVFGFKSQSEKILVLTENELIPKITKIKKGFNQVFVSELKINDFLVHEDHGIALFKGTIKKNIDNIEKEYLVLEYAENDKLFLPVEYSEKITKYIGQAHPKINRLHGASWLEVKEKIKKKTQIIAKELLKIYAEREQSEGYKFSPDTIEQEELERSFPYQETEDQIKVIQEVKDDMEKKKSTKAMDRLICGDVGFGKTEIAMRAAFKAQANNKQVAILCPTTILAKQHFDNFKKRLENFNVKIAVISRFQSKLQQKDILEKLSQGEINIVIGTHRLLSTDVKFKDLGLLVLDEEQRFGVKHKEAIKKLKANIDCLALSATPIPRTLNLSLSGLRDISVINTAPVGRQPVANFVKPYSEVTIEQAMKKELDRNGQIYFLHNKVQTIQAAVKKVEKIIEKYPRKVTVAFAHGQMPEKNLEKIMTDFYDKKIDILVASSIIENGLDVPNVNTIIIDNAVNFGLADLYQLKGRVGRGTKQAFAYFLYKSEDLKEKAKRRLEALLEAKELGSGFQLALRDLEIRGAGNILGKEQSGAVSTIGLNLYCRLLHQAVEESKNVKPIVKEEINPTIDLPISAFLPEDLFSNFQKRLQTYQEIANIQKSDELNQYYQNLINHFDNNNNKLKNYLETIKNLFYILELKIIARQTKIKSIKTKSTQKLNGEKSNRLVITFQHGTNYEKAYQLIKTNPDWDIEDSEIKINQSDLGPDWKNNLKQSLNFFI